MLQSGIINPHLLSLIARFRHTNRIVICDWAFPYWPEIETVDLALTAGIPRVMDVFPLISESCCIGQIWQATEFLEHNIPQTRDTWERTFGKIPVTREPHLSFKKRVPGSIGIIRTGDDTMYGNLILESA